MIKIYRGDVDLDAEGLDDPTMASIRVSTFLAKRIANLAKLVIERGLRYIIIDAPPGVVTFGSVSGIPYEDGQGLQLVVSAGYFHATGRFPRLASYALESDAVAITRLKKDFQLEIPSFNVVFAMTDGSRVHCLVQAKTSQEAVSAVREGFAKSRRDDAWTMKWKAEVEAGHEPVLESAEQVAAI